MKKMKRRREVKIREYGKGRKFFTSLKFERELKKLENSISYDVNISKREGGRKDGLQSQFVNDY